MHLKRVLILAVLVAAAAILGSALAVFYPEVTAFVVVTTVLIGAIEWWQSYRRGKAGGRTPRSVRGFRPS